MNNNILEIDENVVRVNFGNKKTQENDNPDISERVKRIRQSIDRINTLMAELKDCSTSNSKNKE